MKQIPIQYFSLLLSFQDSTGPEVSHRAHLVTTVTIGCRRTLIA